MAKLNDSTLEGYRDDYARDGAVALRQVISPKWIERLRGGVEENLRRQAVMRASTRRKERLGFSLVITALVADRRLS